MKLRLLFFSILSTSLPMDKKDIKIANMYELSKVSETLTQKELENPTLGATKRVQDIINFLDQASEELTINKITNPTVKERARERQEALRRAQKKERDELMEIIKKKEEEIKIIKQKEEETKK